MPTFDLTPLAERIGCLPALEAARGKDLSRVGWQFLGAMLREMPVPDAETKAVVDPVIAGMDRLARGEDWPEARAAAAMAEADVLVAWAVARAAAVLMAVAAAGSVVAAEWSVLAAEWANDAGLPYERQREILMRLMEEAPDADV